MLNLKKRRSSVHPLLAPPPSRVSSQAPSRVASPSATDVAGILLPPQAVYLPSRGNSPRALSQASSPRFCQGASSSQTTTPRGFKISPRSVQFYPLLELSNSEARELRNLILLKPHYFPELIAESVERKKFLNSEDIKNYELKCINGLFYKQDGSLADGAMLYILLPDWTLYGCADCKGLHTWLSQGKPLRAAGVLYFCQGHLFTISNESGHYKPTLKEMLNAIQWFHHIAQSDLLFEDHSEQTPALPFRGIQHYRVSATKLNKFWSMELIPLAQLSDVLSNLYEVAINDNLPYEKATSENQATQIHAGFDNESIEEYVSEALSISKSPELLPHLAILTCLPKLIFGNSRFNGVTRPLGLHIRPRTP